MRHNFFKSAALIILVIVLAVTIISCRQLTRIQEKVLKKREIKLEELESPEVKEIASSKVKASSELESTSSQEQEQILQLIKDYLEVSFLNLNTWKDEEGASRLSSFFTSETQSRVESEDFSGLGLGQKATKKLDSINNAQAKITKLYISYDKKGGGGGVRASVALIEFDLKAVFQQKDGRKADLSAKGAFSLDKASGKWKIDSYQVNQSIDTR